MPLPVKSMVTWVITGVTESFEDVPEPRRRCGIRTGSRPLSPLHGLRRHPGPSLAGPDWELTAGWGSVAGGVGAAGVRVADSVRVVM